MYRKKISLRKSNSGEGKKRCMWGDVEGIIEITSRGRLSNNEFSEHSLIIQSLICFFFLFVLCLLMLPFNHIIFASLLLPHFPCVFLLPYSFMSLFNGRHFSLLFCPLCVRYSSHSSTHRHVISPDCLCTTPRNRVFSFYRLKGSAFFPHILLPSFSPSFSCFPLILPFPSSCHIIIGSIIPSYNPTS